MIAATTSPALLASFDALLARVARECGLSFPRERRPDMERATRLAMARSDETSLERYVQGVAAGERPLDDVLDELTVRETYFFREPEQFAFLREVVVPDLLARREGAALRCWSAGCASGEEAYSLAILLEELGVGARSRIVGTDVSLAAIAAARAARYKPWSLRGEGRARTRPYLRPKDDGWTLAPEIRRRVVFARLNLVDDPCPPAELGPGPGTCDLLLCRNVLVYFDRVALARAVAKLYDALAEGGWLIAASSDPPLGSLAPFFCVPTPRGTFYRKLCERPAVRSLPALVSEASPATPATSPPRSPSATERPPAIAVAPLTASAAPDPSPAAPPVSPSPQTARSLYEAASALIAERRDDEAVVALRQAIYLDGELVVAHLALGLAAARLGRVTDARRSLRTVERLCARLPPRALVPLSGDRSAAALITLARERNAALGAPSGRKEVS